MTLRLRRWLKPFATFSVAQQASRFRSQGVIKIFEVTERGKELRWIGHNLETDFVLTAIACSLTGESGHIDGSTVTITPATMAVGSGTTAVTSSDTALASETMRKTLTSPGCSVTRAGAKVTFAMTLNPGEATGLIGVIGLFGTASGSPSSATGSLTIGGTPTKGDSIALGISGRSVSPYFLPATDTAANVATAFAAWLNNDAIFGGLYTCTASGPVISITSLGQGTVYNQGLTVNVTGGVTCAITSQMSGGATPGGQLLAAANTTFTQGAASTTVIEWSITITN